MAANLGVGEGPGEGFLGGLVGGWWGWVGWRVPGGQGPGVGGLELVFEPV